MYELVISVSINLKNAQYSCPLHGTYIMSKKAYVVQKLFTSLAYSCLARVTVLILFKHSAAF